MRLDHVLLALQQQNITLKNIPHPGGRLPVHVEWLTWLTKLFNPLGCSWGLRKGNSDQLRLEKEQEERSIRVCLAIFTYRQHLCGTSEEVILSLLVLLDDYEKSPVLGADQADILLSLARRQYTTREMQCVYPIDQDLTKLDEVFNQWSQTLL